MPAKTWMTPEFIRAIPKTDLHVHLDGSLRLPTLIDLAKQQKVKLPSYTESGLREKVFKKKYRDLGEYLTGFAYTCAVLREAEALERVAYELAWDNFEEGVRYVEPRFAPQLCAGAGLNLEGVLQAANQGLARAKREINQRAAIKKKQEPPFDYAIIACAMRKFGRGYSPYYDDFLQSHRYTPKNKIYPMASLELVRALVEVRNEKGIPVTGFDLAGEEKGWPPNAHREAFNYAQYHFVKKTVHAGEAYGPPSIFQAITECHANRIGHGTHLFASELVDRGTPAARQKYTADLVEYISSRRITVEVCPTSNLQTIPAIKNLKKHPLGEMIKRRISLTLCTDNRLVSDTTVCREIEKVLKAFPMSAEKLRNIVIYGFKRSFSSKPYPEKRNYVRHVIDYYEKIEKKFQRKR
jgi:adenosine deaminase